MKTSAEKKLNHPTPCLFCNIPLNSFAHGEGLGADVTFDAVCYPIDPKKSHEQIFLNTSV